MAEKVLVCILAQTRAHELTWANFKQHVLDELDADLALCIGVDRDYDYANPFFQHARYRSLLRVPTDWGDEIERIRLSLGIPPGWRRLLDLCQNPYAIFLGGLPGMPGSGAILLVYRWLLRTLILQEDLRRRYDRFVITRSDYFYAAPHPCIEALAPEAIWLPDGEDWGGLVDRHMVVNRDHVIAALSALSDMLRRPGEWVEAMASRDAAYRNSEGTQRVHLERAGLLAQVRRFPYVMYLVRGETDPFGWAEGEFDENTGMYVKYPTEFELANQWKDRFRSRADWLEWSREPPRPGAALAGDAPEKSGSGDSAPGDAAQAD